MINIQMISEANSFLIGFYPDASDHDKKPKLFKSQPSKRPAFLMAVIFFLRDCILSIKCRLHSAQ